LLGGWTLEPNDRTLHAALVLAGGANVDVAYPHRCAVHHDPQTMAADLIVADGTVKRHIRNILGKVQAHSRLEAVARARDIGIIR
jgi:hypothetical protein